MNLMDMYNIVSIEDKVMLDKLFLALINNRNYLYYKQVLENLNKKYNESSIILIDCTNNELRISNEIDRYLNYYFNKKINIFCDPVVLELLNNEPLYNKYVKPIIKMEIKQCFNKMKEKNNLPKLISNAYSNYNNPYYIDLVLSDFKQLIHKSTSLTIREMEQIIKFFIKKESCHLGIRIDFKLVKITEYFKNLLKKSERKFALQKIMDYDVTCAYHNKLFDDSSFIWINISNYRDLYLNNKQSFSKILETIYHEIRHALQSSNQNHLLYNMNEREQIILNFDNKYYIDNHDNFEIEVDASIYALDRTKIIYETYFPDLVNDNKNDLKKMIMSTKKYEKRIELEMKIDSLILKNPNYITKRPELLKEYYIDGYPKGIIDILKQREVCFNDEINAYNEMITRSLNRMSIEELTEKMYFIKDTCPFYLPYIEESLKYQLKEIFKVQNLINIQYQKKNIDKLDFNKYSSKVKDYSYRIQYYYQQLDNVNQIGVAKK